MSRKDAAIEMLTGSIWRRTYRCCGKTFIMLLMLCVWGAGGCSGPREITLFDGQSLGQWKITDFGGQGDVRVENEQIILEMGNDLTGIAWTGPVVRMNYELTLEAKRVQGNDFFCGLTFPVDANCCSLILGGWGGSICGISNLDYYDAANNETTRVIDFENGQWYGVRVRVTPGKIEAWVDEEQIVDVNTAGRVIDTRIEVDLSKPLGIATWRTTGAFRNIYIRKLEEDWVAGLAAARD
jgi:hypothetical protein